MNYRLFLYGLAIWVVATLSLRFAGQYVLRPGDTRNLLILFAVSFPLMALLVRRLCRKFAAQRDAWPAGAISVVLPTLLLDPFSSAFFPVMFPNMSPQVAGVFGGWMLWCCAGAMVGVIVGQQRS